MASKYGGKRSRTDGRSSSKKSSGRGGSERTNSPKKKEKAYKTIGALWEHEEYGESITVDDYYGELVFRPTTKDGDFTGEEFLVKRIYLNEPFREVTNKAADLVIDLANANSTEEITD